MQFSTHAAVQLSHIVTRHCIVPTTGEDEPVLYGYVFISQFDSMAHFCHRCAIVAGPEPL